MEKMKNLDNDAWKWLVALDPKQWSRSHFSDVPTCDILLNNLCESFNSAILEARDKPIITLLEMVRCYMMRRIEAKRKELSRWKTVVGPRIFQLIEENKLKSTHCIADYGGDLAFQVRGMYGDQYVVDLKEKKCACNKWGLCGIPCKHAIACILQRGLNIFDFVHDSLRKSTQEKIYEHVIRPINGPELRH